MSNYVPCTKRQPLKQFQADGTVAKVQRCSAPEAVEHFGQNVTPADCEACPVRSAMLQEAIRNAEYVPPIAKELNTLYNQRPDTESTSLWPGCSNRCTVEVESCCGDKNTELKICDDDCSVWFGQQLSPDRCQQCLVRLKDGT